MDSCRGVNKAEAIRSLLVQMGIQAPPREVIKRLKEQGLASVSCQQVSNEKARLRKKGIIAQGEDLPLSAVKKVKALVDELGSVEIVKRALAELELLQKKT